MPSSGKEPPISSRVAPGDVEQSHYFVATSCWDTAPPEEVLCQKAETLLGGEKSFLIVDDTGHRPKWQIALEIDRMREGGLTFGCTLAGRGLRRAYRRDLASRGETPNQRRSARPNPLVSAKPSASATSFMLAEPRGRLLRLLLKGRAAALDAAPTAT